MSWWAWTFIVVTLVLWVASRRVEEAVSVILRRILMGLAGVGEFLTNLLLLLIPFAILYLLVRFVKLAWEN